ncbi:hypothetical protein DFR28_1011100 [Arenicella xantha]|uniref:Caspase family p20 domain-containing protein n=2 Tax=Arenicella xantha TaxID=644221 RepID=A0A395JPY4_9GAMM|nr:hypothetical protein DFR28_1011100 [Arenicella xantha]
MLAPDVVLPDGSKYEGDVVDGKFSGQGTLLYPSGGFYKGNFKEGLFDGPGIMVQADGSRLEGEFSLGRATGQFSVTNTPSDYTYHGEMLDSQMHGMGKLVTSQHQYEGQFVNGWFEGFGTFTNNNGDVYEGEFKANLYDGSGKITYPSGAVYEGMFVAGLYHGQGAYIQEETYYKGEFVEGKLTGQGEIKAYDGSVYVGAVEAWQANGQGVLTNADGDRIEGEFEDGYISGDGKWFGADGSSYVGSFEYNQFDGDGVLTSSNGDVYTGEFSYGYYDGKGSLVRKQSEADDDPAVLQGEWESGKLVFNAATGERRHQQAEEALASHQRLLDTALSGLQPSDASVANAYFLGIAGDGRQSVFRREVEYATGIMESRYHTTGRSVMLVNDHDSAAMWPIANRRSIQSAITAIGQKMNAEQDVLFIYMTSHGSKEPEFYLNHDSIKLPDLSPQEFRVMLNEAGIKWRVLMISACYSGGFIPELENEHTLLLTAADSESKSFGCSDDADMTYFGRALFKEVLANSPDIALVDAFSEAVELITTWETEQDLDPSNPSKSAPPLIVEKLVELRQIH